MEFGFLCVLSRAHIHTSTPISACVLLLHSTRLFKLGNSVQIYKDNTRQLEDNKSIKKLEAQSHPAEFKSSYHFRAAVASKLHAALKLEMSELPEACTHGGTSCYVVRL